MDSIIYQMPGFAPPLFPEDISCWIPITIHVVLLGGHGTYAEAFPVFCPRGAHTLSPKLPWPNPFQAIRLHGHMIVITAKFFYPFMSSMSNIIFYLFSAELIPVYFLKYN